MGHSVLEDDYTVDCISGCGCDFFVLCVKWERCALTAILLTIGHELTHYFQWINALIFPDRDGASGNKICKICVRRLCRNKGASLSADRMKKGKEK